MNGSKLFVGLAALAMTAIFDSRAEQPGSPPPATVFESGPAPTTLLELFTSEGCSSCPPAEKWMSQLKNSPDLWKKIVPVAFHVDYWDHLGWRDRFAKPEFTERQRAYAATWGGDSIYTPGFVNNGREWRAWFGGSGAQSQSGNVGTLRVAISDDNKVSATFGSSKSRPRPLKLQAALLGNDLESDVKRGENGGRKLRHDFVVLQLTSADMSNVSGQWNGSISFSTKPDGDKPTALAAWITENAVPVQSTGGWLKR